MLAGWEPSEIFGYLRQIQLASVITYIHAKVSKANKMLGSLVALSAGAKFSY